MKQLAEGRRPRYRLSPNEVEQLRREEAERRRKLRIVQVREQAKTAAAKIRGDVQRERKRQLMRLAQQVQEQLEGEKEEEVKRLEQRYDNTLRTIGQAHTQAMVTDKKSSRAEKELSVLEGQARAEERHQAALRKVAMDTAYREYEETKHVRDRRAALVEEKRRAARVAALAPPPPDPIDEALKEKTRLKKAIPLTDLNAFSATHYHIPDFAVQRAPPEQQGDGRAAGEEEDQRTREEVDERRKREHDQVTMARIRGNQALKKEKLKHEYDGLMADLSLQQRADRRRRQQVVSKLPKQVFLPPDRRLEELGDKQMEMERAFEDMYTQQMNLSGNLSLTLDPNISPASEVDDSVGEEPAVVIPSMPSVNPALREVTNLSRPQAELGKPEAVLKKLMNRIKEQRSQADTGETSADCRVGQKGEPETDNSGPDFRTARLPASKPAADPQLELSPLKAAGNQKPHKGYDQVPETEGKAEKDKAEMEKDKSEPEKEGTETGFLDQLRERLQAIEVQKDYLDKRMRERNQAQQPDQSQRPTYFPYSQAPPTLSQAPHPLPQVPPSLSQAPPPLPQVPPTLSRAPPPRHQAPPSRPQAPPSLLQAPPSFPQVPPSLSYSLPQESRQPAYLTAQTRPQMSLLHPGGDVAMTTGVAGDSLEKAEPQEGVFPLHTLSSALYPNFSSTFPSSMSSAAPGSMISSAPPLLVPGLTQVPAHSAFSAHQPRLTHPAPSVPGTASLPLSRPAPFLSGAGLGVGGTGQLPLASISLPLSASLAAVSGLPLGPGSGLSFGQGSEDRLQRLREFQRHLVAKHQAGGEVSVCRGEGPGDAGKSSTSLPPVSSAPPSLPLEPILAGSGGMFRHQSHPLPVTSGLSALPLSSGPLPSAHPLLAGPAATADSSSGLDSVRRSLPFDGGEEGLEREGDFVSLGDASHLSSLSERGSPALGGSRSNKSSTSGRSGSGSGVTGSSVGSGSGAMGSVVARAEERREGFERRQRELQSQLDDIQRQKDALLMRYHGNQTALSLSQQRTDSAASGVSAVSSVSASGGGVAGISAAPAPGLSAGPSLSPALTTTAVGLGVRRSPSPRSLASPLEEGSLTSTGHRSKGSWAAELQPFSGSLSVEELSFRSKDGDVSSLEEYSILSSKSRPSLPDARPEEAELAQLGGVVASAPPLAPPLAPPPVAEYEPHELSTILEVDTPLTENKPPASLSPHAQRGASRRYIDFGRHDDAQEARLSASGSSASSDVRSVIEVRPGSGGVIAAETDRPGWRGEETLFRDNVPECSTFKPKSPSPDVSTATSQEFHSLQLTLDSLPADSPQSCEGGASTGVGGTSTGVGGASRLVSGKGSDHVAAVLFQARQFNQDLMAAIQRQSADVFDQSAGSTDIVDQSAYSSRNAADSSQASQL